MYSSDIPSKVNGFKGSFFEHKDRQKTIEGLKLNSKNTYGGIYKCMM